LYVDRAGQRGEQGGLARAVRPHHADGFPSSKVEVDAVQHDEVAVAHP
jgi:hypothetical protein